MLTNVSVSLPHCQVQRAIPSPDEKSTEQGCLESGQSEADDVSAWPDKLMEQCISRVLDCGLRDIIGTNDVRDVDVVGNGKGWSLDAAYSWDPSSRIAVFSPPPSSETPRSI